MKYLCILALALLWACQAERGNNDVPYDLASPGATGPENYTDDERTIHYDFNGDGTLDRLRIIDNPDRETDGLGIARDLVVEALLEGATGEWYRSETAVLPSAGGGMLGDPLQGLEFNRDRKLIAIHHFGGSRERWSYTHQYRYQRGDFQLISASIHFGAPCDQWEQFDYMVATGEAVYEKIEEDCEIAGQETSDTVANKAFLAELDTLPVLRTFQPGENRIDIPGIDRSMFY